MSKQYTRREALQETAGWGATGMIVTTLASAAQGSGPSTAPGRPIRYCLNTSTIRGQKLSLAEEIELVAKAGYDAIEPWIGEIEQAVERGQSLRDIQQRAADSGLTVESAIGFAPWIVDDDARRAQALEAMRRDMDLVRQIGGTRIAAPPAGATDRSDLNLDRAAERYARVLELGADMGVTPQLEVWGFSQSLSRLSELMYVAIAAGRADACLLPDVYHLHRGGSDFNSLALVPGRAIHVMHLNDYPGAIPRTQLKDQDRVYPGDGVAPLGPIIRQLRANGFQGFFSLELFNPSYWQQPVDQVLATGLAKMKAAVAAAE